MTNIIPINGPGVTLEATSSLIESAVYARYSDAELQRASSNDQQIRACREAAGRDNGYIPDSNIFADKGLRGADEGRPQLQRLMDVVRSGKARFKRLYIFDTSRFARDEELTHKLKKFFKFHNITLYFVTSGMKSGTSGFEVQHAIFSMMDEQYSVALGENVKRGHKEQLLKGYLPYGRCYGYASIAKLDPTCSDSYDSRRSREGVIQTINPAEADVVRLIYELYLREGLGYEAIARRLNELDHKSPRKPTKNPIRGWQTSAIRTILKNVRYTGLILHGRVETIKNPKTKKLVHRARPESEWTRYENPNLRIISDEDFQTVKAQMDRRKDKGEQRKRGGLARTEKSRGYVWSGLFKCGECGGAISICQPNTYMCTSAYRKLNCRNMTKLNRDSVQRHLMEAMASGLKRACTFEWLEDSLLTDVRSQQARMRQSAAGLASRREIATTELLQLNSELDGLAVAMMKHGFSETFSAILREKEARKAVLVEILENDPKPTLEIAEKDIAEFLSTGLEGLADILLSDPIRCKEELSKRVNHLILEPIVFENSPGYRVRGDLRIFGGNEPKMLSGNGGITAKHLDLTLGLDGLILKLDSRGAVLRIVWKGRAVGGGTGEPLALAA